MSIQDKQELLRKANEAYYEGDPIMTDEQYDALEREIAGTDPDKVAGGYVPKSRKVTHVEPMLSLAKVHSTSDLKSWLKKITDECGDDASLCIEPKWDGFSVEVITSDGEFLSASTRGSGLVGEDITASTSNISALHSDIAAQLAEGNIPASGEGLLHYEIVMDRDTLTQINTEYEMDLQNPRNAAAGIIRREDELGAELAAKLRVESHEWAPDTTVHLDAGKTDEVIEAVEKISENRLDYPCDIDGVVLKVEDKDFRDELGVTSHSPRWAVAYKFVAEQSETTLRKVVWTQGRTGRITPVAEFDPVFLAGATIRNATLHNVDFVNNLNLHIGDIITVKRAGDVIPYVSDSKTGPDSESEAVVQPDDIDSDTAILDHVRYALACLDTDGVGPGVIRDLKTYGLLDTSGIVSALRSLLLLKKGDIQSLPGYGEASESKIIWTLQEMRSRPLHSWVAALGIPGIGRTATKALAQKAGSLQAIIDMSRSDIEDIDLFGKVRVDAAVAAQSGIYVELRDMLDELEVVIPAYDSDDEVDIIEDDRWAGKNVVVTGVIEGYTRKEMTEELTRRGAVVGSSVSSKTDILVHGEKAGSKLSKAEKAGVKIIDANAESLF